MAKEFKNTKVEGLTVSETMGQYILTVVEESPFAGFGGAGVEHTITLFSRRNGEVDPATVERTQENVRQQLGDENIVFTDPSQATNDENHIANWVKNNHRAPVGLVTQNDNGFFDLGAGLSGGGSFGGSAYLSNYKAGDGSYDPSKHRVPFYEALTPRQQDAVNTMDATKYPEIQTSTRSAYKGILIPGIVTDIILGRANAFGSTPEKYTRQDVRDEIVDTLTSGKRATADNQEMAKRIEALPDDYAYVDLLRILGGSTAEKVSGTKQGSIQGLLENADRTSIRFYIQNPETGKVFQSTDLKAGATAQTIDSQNNVQFEFLTDDFTQADLVRFLLNIAGLQNTEFGIQNIFEDVVEAGLYDQEAGEFKIDSMEDLLAILRSLFVGRKVDVQSTLYSARNGKAGVDRLGTSIRKVYMEKNVDAIQTGLITDMKPAASVTAAPTSATGESSTPANPFAAAAPVVADVKEETEEVAANPFASAAQEAPAVEAAPEPAPAAAVEEDEDEDEDDVDLTNNPFMS